MHGFAPQPIINQLSDERTFILEQAAAALAKLAYQNEVTRAAITQVGGIKPLISLLRTEGADYAAVRRNGANALANLASDTAARDEIVSSDGIRPLVLVLSEEQNSTKKYAARALARLSVDTASKAAGEAKPSAAETKAAAEAAAVVVDRTTTQGAIAEAGAIEPLVSLLEGNCGPEAQEEAAGALYALAEHEGNRLRITAADGIAWLVKLLGNERAKAREHAEGALVRLSIEPANRAQIIKKLVNMLQDASAGGQEQAAAALANLARESEDNRKSIVEANGIIPLLALLESTSPVAKENAVGAIAELCRNSKSIQSLIAKEGGIPKLVGAMLDFSVVNKERSMIQLWTLDAAAIKEMAKGNRKNQDAIAEAGGIAPLVAMLGSSAPQMQANAAGALANLASGHPDNQSAIAKTGAVAPLCLLIKEGVGQQTKDESAQAIWSLAADHQPNKDMIAKLGGFDPLLGLLVTGTTERSQKSVAGALAALAAKHNENRQIIAKRLVGLLGSSAVKTSDRAERLLLTCSTFHSDSAANQVAIAKLGGIPPLNTWLGNMAASTQTQAAHAMLCLATDNATTQLLIAKSNGIPPLVKLVKRSPPEAQDAAARALWHLASQPEPREMIVNERGIEPLIGMLAAESETAPELAAIILVRLARGSSDVAVEIAHRGGIAPLTVLLKNGSPGAQKQAASCLAELALVGKNRDQIANAGGIEQVVRLLTSPSAGIPEVAARVLAHIAHVDESDEALKTAIATDDLPTILAAFEKHRAGASSNIYKQTESARDRLRKAESRRAIAAKAAAGGDSGPMTAEEETGGAGGGATAAAATGSAATAEGGEAPKVKETAAAEEGTGGGAAAGEIRGSAERRAKIHMSGGIRRLIAMLEGSPLSGGASKKADEKGLGLKEDVVAKVGVKEQAAIALADIAQSYYFIPGTKAAPGTWFNNPQWYDNSEMQDAIIDADAVAPLLSLQRTGTILAQEHTARTLWHLAKTSDTHRAIIEANAIPELVQLLKTGSEKAQEMAAAGLSDLALGAVTTREKARAADKAAGRKPTDTRSVSHDPTPGGGLDDSSDKDDEDESAADCLVFIADAGGIMPVVALLSSGTTHGKEFAACCLWHLALDRANQSAIARCNGIQPLVLLLDDGTPIAHTHAADALARLAIANSDNQAQISKHCVALLGNESTGTQQRSARVLRDLAARNPGSPVVVVNAGAISPLVSCLSEGVPAVKEEAAGALSALSFNSPSTQLAIASGLVVLVGAGSPESMEHVTQLLLILAHDPINCARTPIEPPHGIPSHPCSTPPFQR